ncbi:MAG: T9SS type A sorting domain-containing protein [Bacteroidetes bacterium]|nr:T9SS type A sorting domain-containing protein [Bacteroidota bacterium]
MIFLFILTFFHSTFINQPNYVLPLKTGNLWVYKFYDRLSGDFGYWVFQVSDSILSVNGKSYHQIVDPRYPEKKYHFLRKSEDGKYHHSFDGQKEELYFDPGLNAGDTLIWEGESDRLDIVYETGYILVFDKPVKFYKIIYDVNSLISYTNLYCEKFGLLFTSMSESTESLSLQGCVLDGVVYGDTTTTSVGVKEALTKPESVWLGQNYPNPFNPETVVPVRVSRAGWVKVAVFDVSGREIQVLKQGFWEPGEYRLPFSGAGLPSGLYLIRLEAAGQTQSRKMMLVR